MVLSERMLGFLWSDGATTPRWYCAQCDLRFTNAEVLGWNARTCRRGHRVQRLAAGTISSAALLLGFCALLALVTAVFVPVGSGPRPSRLTAQLLKRAAHLL